MNSVQYVRPDQLYGLWDDVKDFLDASVKVGSGDYTLEQLKGLLASNAQTLLIVVKEDKIIGAITIEFINYPNDRVMFITNCGGKNIVNAETFNQIEEWGRSQGATKARSYAKDSQSKLYLQKLGCNIMNHVMEKKL
jgi:hypothetical protein|tara:strand:+ start:85 stop:495 length:411 start_codon:yes stop_codon:yes gene_type:complete